ncbi:MAG: hypothetical protein WEA82_09045 [Idiomarina sp.]
MAIFFILLWITCGFIAAGIASGRNHNAGVWFVIGALFGVFGLIGAFLLPDKSKEKDEADTTSAATEIKSKTRTCPFCAEEIKAQAVICRFCGKEVPPVEPAPKVVSKPITEAEVQQLKSEAGDDAVQLSYKDSDAWHCICGCKNDLTIKNCEQCKRNRDFVLSNYNATSESQL